MGLKRRNPARTRLLSVPAAPAIFARPAPVSEVAANDEAAITAKAEAPLTGSALPHPASAAPAAPRVSSEERHHLIAKIAYGFAERAGFSNDPLTNWLSAEREVDAMLSRMAS